MRAILFPPPTAAGQFCRRPFIATRLFPDRAGRAPGRCCRCTPGRRSGHVSRLYASTGARGSYHRDSSALRNHRCPARRWNERCRGRVFRRHNAGTASGHHEGQQDRSIRCPCPCADRCPAHFSPRIIMAKVQPRRRCAALSCFGSHQPDHACLAVVRKTSCPPGRPGGQIWQTRRRICVAGRVFNYSTAHSRGIDPDCAGSSGRRSGCCSGGFWHRTPVGAENRRRHRRRIGRYSANLRTWIPHRDAYGALRKCGAGSYTS